MDAITELYPAGTADRLEKQNRIWRAITAGVAFASLAACIVLCVLTGTANAAAMELRVCLISLLGGWTVIFLYTHFVTGGKRQLAHLSTLSEEPRKAVTGTVTLDARRIAIRGSITVQTLLVNDGTQTRRVSISASRTKALPALPARLTVYTVHGYAVAWEAEDAAS